MPEKKHLRGVSDTEQRQYEHIKEEAEKEVAARTVLKQHREKGAQQRPVSANENDRHRL